MAVPNAIDSNYFDCVIDIVQKHGYFRESEHYNEIFEPLMGKTPNPDTKAVKIHRDLASACRDYAIHQLSTLGEFSIFQILEECKLPDTIITFANEADEYKEKFRKQGYGIE